MTFADGIRLWSERVGVVILITAFPVSLFWSMGDGLWLMAAALAVAIVGFVASGVAKRF